MKNKKKLLIAVAAMGLLAVGTAGVGTAAWFQSTQANNFKSGSVTGTQQVGVVETPDAASLGDVYLRLEIDLSSVTLDLTTSDGYSYGITSEGTVVGYAPDKAYATISLGATGSVNSKGTADGTHYAYSWHATAADALSGDNALTTSDELVKNITAHTIDVEASAGSRARITTLDPATNGAASASNIHNNHFYTAFTTSPNGKGVSNLKVGELSVTAATGAVTGTISFSMSLTGEATDRTKKAVDDASDLDESDIEASIDAANRTVTLSLKTRA